MTLNGEQTRDAIVKSALKLFATRGIGETSLRAVAREAGINDASIHYHFGSKDQVIRAAYEKVMKPINAERSKLLRQLLQERQGKECESHELIGVMYWPVFRRFGGRKGKAKRAREGLSLVAQMRVNPSPSIRQMIDRQSDSFIDLFHEELQKAIPRLLKETLWQRMSFVNSIAWDALAQPFATEMDEIKLLLFFDDFLAFSESGLSKGT